MHGLEIKTGEPLDWILTKYELAPLGKVTLTFCVCAPPPTGELKLSELGLTKPPPVPPFTVKVTLIVTLSAELLGLLTTTWQV